MAKVKTKSSPKIAIIMGSHSDWETMKNATDILDDFGVAYLKEIVSAHRTPEKLRTFAQSAKSRGFEIIIAGAGGSAHLPGMVAAFSEIPVLGVPVESKALKGLDSLLSIVQMPAGIPVGSLAVGVPGAKNAALLSIAILANHDPVLFKKWSAFRVKQTQKVISQKL
jgi:5-(carboxyamino)imidazole ribonucleotide mutase